MDEIWRLLAQILSEQESSVEWVMCRLCSLWQAALGEYDVCVVSCRDKLHEGKFLVCGAGDDPAASNVREFTKLASTDWTETVSNQLATGFEQYEVLKLRCNDRFAVGGVLVGINSAIADDDLVETLKLISANALREAQGGNDSETVGDLAGRATSAARTTAAGVVGAVAGRASADRKTKKGKAKRGDEQDPDRDRDLDHEGDRDRGLIREPMRGDRKSSRDPADWQSVALDPDRLESLAEFAAGAGHEINNPLGTIVGRVQLLLREETDIDRRQSLSTIGGQAYRIRDMIGDVMLFARPPQPDPEWVQMADIVEEVLTGFEEELAAGEFDVDVEFARSARVYADPVQVRVAFGALIRNSIEAAVEGGSREIQVRAEEAAVGRGKGLEITVADNGNGMTEEQRRHLFDPFYSGRQAGRGLGFGLSKTWRIVSNHGGTVDVTTERGWTTFKLTFPDSPD